MKKVLEVIGTGIGIILVLLWILAVNTGVVARWLDGIWP